jgi:hypothetical protein
MGHHLAMTTRAELSSIASSLDELNRRLTVFAEAARASEQDDVAGELFGVERSLNAALRRLRRVIDGLD